MSATEAKNKPRKMSFGGLTLTVRELGSATILEILEAHVIKEEQARIERVAEMITDPVEANKYRIEKGELIPYGAVLEDRARQLTGDLPDEVAADIVYAMLGENSKHTLEDIRIAFRHATKEEAVAVIGSVFGWHRKKDHSPAGKGSKPSRKNTAGRRK